MSTSPTETPSPARKLAFVYHPRSFGALSLVDAAKGVCDLLWIVDTSHTETASMARLLRRLGTCVDVAGLSVDEAASIVTAHHPLGILALADESLRWTAEVAARICLPFLTPQTVLRLTDKYAQRRALRDAGLAAPRSWVITDDDAATVWSRIENEALFPAVLKPRWGEGSRDTLPVHSLGELRTLWESNRASDGRARDFVLEEYIPDARDGVGGDGFAGYVSVESFVLGGQIRHLAITGRMPPAQPFRETGFFIPSALDPEQQRSVLEVASKAAAAVGVSVGCLHTEIKLTPSGPVVIEVNGRIGGGVPEMLVAASGVQMLSIAMRLALGEKVTCDAMPPCHQLAYLFYVQAPAELTKVTAVDGLIDLRQVPGVHAVVLNRGPGQRVDWREGNHGHVFSVSGTAANHDELRQVRRLITSLVRIEGE